MNGTELKLHGIFGIFSLIMMKDEKAPEGRPMARKNDDTVTTSKSQKTDDFPLTLSLWLLPPKSAQIKIQEQIDRLAKDRGPSFPPHVTIIGGIPCRSEEHAQEMAQTLQDGLRGYGKIPCSFSSIPFTSKGVWSQALFLTMEMGAPFMNLCQKCRMLLGLDVEDWRFAPPAGLPHLSLFYGVSNLPDKKEVLPVDPFYSYSVALWRTDPSTLESVPNWKEIAVIDLN